MGHKKLRLILEDSRYNHSSTNILIAVVRACDTKSRTLARGTQDGGKTPQKWGQWQMPVLHSQPNMLHRLVSLNMGQRTVAPSLHIAKVKQLLSYNMPWPLARAGKCTWSLHHSK